MRGHATTIKDIAKELSISPSTVSRALKDHPDISNETKVLVKETAERLNYEPNIIALSLKKQKTFTLGLIIPEIVHFFFSTVISGIEDQAHEEGYKIIICQSNEEYQREIDSTQTLYNSRVEGLLISVAQTTENIDHIQKIHDRGLPIIFFDRLIEDVKADFVIVDDEHGGFLATEHLIEQGYERIGHIAGHPSLKLTQARLLGYRKALEKHGLLFDEGLVAYNDSTSLEKSTSVSEEILSSENPPGAVFASNDMSAFGALNAARKKGLKIPEEFGIVGFSNWQFGELIEPALSTVNQPGYEMGREAARLLIQRIKQFEDDNYDYSPETIVLPTELIVRESSVRKKS